MYQLELFEVLKELKELDENSRKCIKCLVIKDIKQFGFTSTEYAGRCYTCKTCKNKHAKLRKKLKDNNPSPPAGECPICKNFTKKWVLDHIHNTEEFRGYICGRCNVALGIFKDDLNILKSALEYLTSSMDKKI